MHFRKQKALNIVDFFTTTIKTWISKMKTVASFGLIKV